MQLIPVEITIVEIAVVVILAALAIVGLVIALKQKARVEAMEAALNEERRRMAELHTFLERVSRTNTTRPDMDMGLGADPYGANPYGAQPQVQPMGAMGQPQPQPQPGAMPEYNPYAAPMADPAMMAAPQSAPFPAQGQPAAYGGADALRAQEQQAAKQQALEYAKYQERMQQHADQMQQQAMMPGSAGGSRPQRQTQPVPPR